MNYYTLSVSQALNKLGIDKNLGINDKRVAKSREKYGANVFNKSKKKSVFSKILSSLKEPMLIILLFGFVLALGVSIGKYFKTRQADFSECLGIFFAISLSVIITIVMEGSSEKAFALLNNIYQNTTVKAIRNGKIVNVSQKDVVVGDIIIIETGDKIVADGRLIESNELLVDESALTGESLAVDKDCLVNFSVSTPLAERKNMVYSGTFVTAGSGKMLVTAVGNNTEIGGIASQVSDEEDKNTPLQQKLTKLGKTVTIIGASCSVFVFILSIIKLAYVGNLTFNNIQELFVSCIILIVAAVPEGLPTIVAVSLALNMIKLAKQNALIKKMSATETAGAVSVICSDKTGTLTQNKMTVLKICTNEFCTSPESLVNEILFQNFILNSTAEQFYDKKGKPFYKGNATECALLEAYNKKRTRTSYKQIRESFIIEKVEPFSSKTKTMTTFVKTNNGYRKLVKGAPEYVLEGCKLTSAQKEKIILSMGKYQKKAQRVLCFAHSDVENIEENTLLTFDGFVTMADPVRDDVKRAVADCKRAGIKVKMLTGDNFETAYAIAQELNIAVDKKSVINGRELEELDDNALKKVLPKISVVSRSTPAIKLRVVKALKELGEVVAVTGDGTNDAPAIKHADVGFAMGQSGTEITKEVADVVLLDDSFSSVVKAIAFGRSVYKNLQRFILFQLSVNLSSLLFITVCAIIGLPSPFNTLQLLWINVIMDGPPALTLGLEAVSSSVMTQKPVKRSEGILNRKMYLRVLFNGVFVGIIMVMQYLYNFLGASKGEQTSCIFTLFILFQLFNAFNCRELGLDSIFKSINKNKIMVVTFLLVFLVHLIIVQALPWVFGGSSMSVMLWIKCIITSFSIIAVSEITKLFYRIIKGVVIVKRLDFNTNTKLKPTK